MSWTANFHRFSKKAWLLSCYLLWVMHGTAYKATLKCIIRSRRWSFFLCKTSHWCRRDQAVWHSRNPGPNSRTLVLCYARSMSVLRRMPLVILQVLCPLPPSLFPSRSAQTLLTVVLLHACPSSFYSITLTRYPKLFNDRNTFKCKKIFVDPWISVMSSWNT